MNIVKAVNISLSTLVPQLDSLSLVHTAIYAAASTVIELNGQNLFECNRDLQYVKNKTEPGWRKRLINQINSLRSDINIINEFLNSNRSKKVCRKIGKISNRAHVVMEKPNTVTKLIELKDMFRQKLQIKAARLRRYNELTKRKQQNNLFERNQRKFYRMLENNHRNEENNSQKIDSDRFKVFWQDIWSQPMQFNENAEWLPQIEEATRPIPEMMDVNILTDEIRISCSRSPNWKAPGLDKIHMFWLKYFSTLHPIISTLFNEIVNAPSNFPGFLAEGVTYLLPKEGNKSDPKNYRPITCLSVLYKLFTSILHSKIYRHCHINNIIHPEQKGCIKESFGCKEQLVIDSIIMNHAAKKCRNLCMAYIDYKKAFDSVPHSWLLKVLKLYKIHPYLVNTISYLMSNWKTHIQFSTLDTAVDISRGIYQGDSLSPLLFCLAINPLSTLLNQTCSGYRIMPSNNQSYMSHLLYMDDIKIYSETPKQLSSMINIIKVFSDDIKMSFGYEKCAEIHIKKGKLIVNEINDFHQLGKDDTYKYLGIQQSRKVNNTKVKEEFMNRYRSRLIKVLKTKLNSRNLITSINTFAVPVLTHSFGVIKYSDTDLNALDRMTRTLMTKYRFHHPKSSVERMYLPRKEGGRGLLNVSYLCKSVENKMKNYFSATNNRLLNIIKPVDNNFTPLNLSVNLVDQAENLKTTFHNENLRSLKEKVLHGKYINAIDDDCSNKPASIQWLKKGYLYPETEGFVVAIQDKVIRTRNYEKYILKGDVMDLCRKCNSPGETIEHVMAGCPAMADNMYLGRHNQTAKIIHSQLGLKYNLLTNPPPYYKYNPEPVLEDSHTILYWDRPVLTDKTIDFNRPDILLIQKTLKTALIIDIGVPLTKNVLKTEKDKVNKYTNLAIEMKNVWKLNKVTVVPIIISAEGIVSKSFVENLTKLGLPDGLLTPIQKATLLQTCHIIRKFLTW